VVSVPQFFPQKLCTHLSSPHTFCMPCLFHCLRFYHPNNICTRFIIFLSLAQQPPVARASSFTRFLDHTQGRTTVGRTPLDEWSAYRRELYLTTHDSHNIQTSITPGRLEPTIPAS
jgi:hypothetical protein